MSAETTIVEDTAAIVFTPSEFDAWRQSVDCTQYYSQALYDAFRIQRMITLMAQDPDLAKTIFALSPTGTAWASTSPVLAEQSRVALETLEGISSCGDREASYDLARIIPILTCNSHRYDHGGNSCALFARIAAAFNHDCDPNCSTELQYLENNTPVLIIRTVRSVQADEELTISYVPLLLPGENGKLLAVVY